MKSITFCILFIFASATIAQSKKTVKLINESNALHINGQTAQAIGVLDKAIANEPNYADAYLIRGEYKKSTGNLLGAIDDFENALNKNPKIHEAWAMLGQVKISELKFEEAIKYFDNAIEINSEIAAYYENRAFSYAQMGNAAESKADYEKAIQLDPGNKKVQRNYIRLLSKTGQGVLAWEKANKLSSKYPKDAKIRHLVGQISEDLGNCYSAIIDYDKAIAINPNYIQAYLDRGGIKDDCVNDEVGAVKDFTKVLQIDSTRIMAYYYRSSPYIDLGKYDLAINDCKSYIKKDSTNARVFSMLGYAYLLKNEEEKAIEALKKSIKLDSLTPYAYVQMAGAYITLKNPKKAVKVLAPIHAQNSENTDLILVLAQAQFDLKEYKSALSLYNQGREIDSLQYKFHYGHALTLDKLNQHVNACHEMQALAEIGLLEARNFILNDCKNCIDSTEFFGVEAMQIAMYYFYQGNIIAALNQINIAIGYDSTNAVYYYERGFANRRLERYDEALNDYKKSIELDPNKSEAYGGVAHVAIIQEKNEEEAKKYLKKAIEITPTDAGFHNNYGVVEMHLENYQKAIPYFKQAIRLAPYTFNAYRSIATCYLKIGDKENACIYLSLALEKGCKDPKIGLKQYENCQ